MMEALNHYVTSVCQHMYCNTIRGYEQFHYFLETYESFCARNEYTYRMCRLWFGL